MCRKPAGRSGRSRYPGGFSNVSRPLFDQGLLFLNTGFGRPEIWAVRPDGRGEISQSHVVWKSKAKNLPAKPSSVLVGELLFCVSDNGFATCLEAKTGKTVWQERIHGFFSASPLGRARPGLFLRSGRQDDGHRRPSAS